MWPNYTKAPNAVKVTEGLLEVFKAVKGVTAEDNCLALITDRPG